MVISRLKAAQQGTRRSIRQKTPSTMQAAKVMVSRVFTVKRPFRRSARASIIRWLLSRADTIIASTWLKITKRSRFSGTIFRVNMVVTAAQIRTTITFSSSASCSFPVPISESS